MTHEARGRVISEGLGSTESTSINVEWDSRESRTVPVSFSSIEGLKDSTMSPTADSPGDGLKDSMISPTADSPGGGLKDSMISPIADSPGDGLKDSMISDSPRPRTAQAPMA